MAGEPTVDTRLADLQRTVEVGFATIKGEMALFSERDRVAELLHGQQAIDTKDLRDRVDRHGRQIAWAYGAAAGFSATSGLIVWALSHH